MWCERILGGKTLHPKPYTLNPQTPKLDPSRKVPHGFKEFCQALRVSNSITLRAYMSA